LKPFTETAETDSSSN